MNGDNCQNCTRSAWVQRANDFLNNNRRNPIYQNHIATIEFLLQNGHCGMNHRTPMDSIIDHLNQQNPQMTREDFQNRVLTDLKREGIVATLVYPGRQGGVFIPCDDDEVKRVAEQVIDRVTQELRNLEGITNGTQVYDMIGRLRLSAEGIRRELEGL